MRTFFALLSFLGPRLIFALYWFYLAEFVHQVFNTWLWPLLGVLFLPWTALIYVLAHTSYDQIFAGLDWLWLGVALAIDLLTYAAGNYYRVKRANAISPMEWIERSMALRLFLYFLMLIIGSFAAVFFVSALIGAGLSLAFFAVVFLVYLFLGFVFCFVDPAMPWVPALLLSAPVILLMCYFSSGSDSIVFLPVFLAASAGASTLGAYLGALLLKRGKNKAASGLPAPQHNPRPK